MSLLFIFCRKMTAFIKLKANTGFCIKKSKLVQQETDAIDSSYQKKFKQATMSQQITRSTVANKTRLRVLGARQKSLDNIFDKAAKRLGKTAQDNDRYECVLKGCISVGFYALNELKPKSRARKLVSSCLALMNWDFEDTRPSLRASRPDQKHQRNDTFPQFPRLALELQDIIWTFALPDERRMIRISQSCIAEILGLNAPLQLLLRPSPVAQSCWRARYNAHRKQVKDTVELYYEVMEKLSLRQLGAIVDSGLRVGMGVSIRPHACAGVRIQSEERWREFDRRWQILERANVRQRSWHIIDERMIYVRAEQAHASGPWDFHLGGGGVLVFYVNKEDEASMKRLRKAVSKSRYKSQGKCLRGSYLKYDLQQFIEFWRPAKSWEGVHLQGRDRGSRSKAIESFDSMLDDFDKVIPVFKVRVIE